MEIVAELSCNHLGSLDRMLSLVSAAADAGADTVKLQCWHPDHMVVSRDYVLDSGPWKGRNLRELYAEAHTPWDWFPAIFDKAHSLGINCFASVFDVEALHFLETIGCPRYKIASFEALDSTLIEAVARTGKPVVLSTGLLTWHKLNTIALTSLSYSKTTLLKCVSEYPARPSSYNLCALEYLKTMAVHAGVSDHTLGDAVAVAAATLGADMLEKHFTLSRRDGGLDADFSVEPVELRMLVTKVHAIEAALEKSGYHNEPSAHSLELRRSLWVSRPIKAGNVIKPGDVISSRPAGGLDPDRLPYVVGSRATRDYAAGEPYLE